VFEITLKEYIGFTFSTKTRFFNGLCGQIRNVCFRFKEPDYNLIHKLSNILIPEEISFKMASFWLLFAPRNALERDDFKKQAREFTRRYHLESTLIYFYDGQVIKDDDNNPHEDVLNHWVRVLK
jgi:hypothetical protein